MASVTPEAGDQSSDSTKYTTVSDFEQNAVARVVDTSQCAARAAGSTALKRAMTDEEFALDNFFAESGLPFGD